MPRRSKGPRLYLDPQERVWLVRDGSRKRRTGCGEGEIQRAEEALAQYIAEKYEPVSDSRPDRLIVADVLAYYLEHVAPSHRSKSTTAHAADRLLEWWGTKPLTDVKRSTCAAYVGHRTSQSVPQARTEKAMLKKVSTETARRELTVLRAAINAYHAEHMLNSVPVVTLPEASPPRERWLTRNEAASLIAAARKNPDVRARDSLVRFILVGLYTGSRSGVIRALQWMPNTTSGWVDLDAGVMHRKPAGERATTKRKPPLRIPIRLLGHMRRWRDIDAHGVQTPCGAKRRVTHIVHYAGLPVEKQRRSWSWARLKAGLGPDVTPHILRHTCATWMMQSGIDQWETAGFLGMSPEILWRVYGHHHTDFQKNVADRIGRR